MCAAPIPIRCVRLHPPGNVDVLDITQLQLAGCVEVDTAEAILPNRNVVAVYARPHTWAGDSHFGYGYHVNRIWRNSSLVDQHHESVYADVFLVARHGLGDQLIGLTLAEAEACRQRFLE
jgi:hypothetical protein